MPDVALVVPALANFENLVSDVGSMASVLAGLDEYACAPASLIAAAATELAATHSSDELACCSEQAAMTALGSGKLDSRDATALFLCVVTLALMGVLTSMQLSGLASMVGFAAGVLINLALRRPD